MNKINRKTSNSKINVALAFLGIFASSAIIISQYYSIKANKMAIKLTKEQMTNQGMEVNS